jgi:hypothetical protein
MNNRAEIKDFIVGLEKKFPVNSWKVNSIHIWPYIRIKIYFYLINSIEKPLFSTQVKKSKSRIDKLKSLYRNIRSVFFYLRWIKSLTQKENLFVGADAHRVDYKNSRFNRYFDVMIEKYSIQKTSIYFEYGKNTKKQYNSDLIFTFSEALKGFLFLNKLVKTPKDLNLEGYDSFLNFLKKDKLFERFTNIYSIEMVAQWAVEVFYLKVLFFQKVLRIVQPKKMVILCYYLEDIFALTAAANQLKISTIEMQHGPQPNVHLAYSNWSSLPESGYDMIPKNFWCWDQGSYTVIQDWTKNNQNYSVKVIGNPWIDYWKAKEMNYKHQNFILYSLQPSPLTIEQLFPESILNFIKSNPHKWFIRLHPRQLNEMGTIKSFLKCKGVVELVNIDEATYDPLPLLLSKASLHLTHFSGTVIEASFFNVFTVLLNEIGIFSFQDLISAQKAVYLNPDDSDFQQKFNAIIQQKNNLPRDKNVTSFQENLFEQR